MNLQEFLLSLPETLLGMARTLWDLLFTEIWLGAELGNVSLWAVLGGVGLAVLIIKSIIFE